jgi:hypothetical protein
MLRSTFPFFTFLISLKVYDEGEVLTGYILSCGARGGVVVKAISYKPAGRGFDSRWCHWNFSVT